MADDLTGFPFLEDFVDDLRHLEEFFTPPAHTVEGFKFTRPQLSTLINAIETVLALKRQIETLDK